MLLLFLLFRRIDFHPLARQVQNLSGSAAVCVLPFKNQLVALELVGDLILDVSVVDETVCLFFLKNGARGKSLKRLLLGLLVGINPDPKTELALLRI